MYDCSAYNIEGDPTLGENCYRVWHSNKSETIIWGQHKLLVKEDKGKESYSCECKEWDHTGLFCVHLLHAFIEVKVERIPHQYIFQRYTRNARSDVDFDTNDKILTGEDGNTQSYRTKTLIPKAMKAVRAGRMSSAAHRRLLEVLEEVTNEISKFPADIGAEARKRRGEAMTEDSEDSSSDDSYTEGGIDETRLSKDNIAEASQALEHVGCSKLVEAAIGKDSRSACRVGAIHVLGSTRDIGNKSSSVRSEGDQLHGQDLTKELSLLPPEKAKPKGRKKTEAEKATVTLGASGDKLGTRKCTVCGQYATHNARTCLTLEHNRMMLEEKRNKKRGRPAGAKNKKLSWKQATDSEVGGNRRKTRQNVVAITTGSEQDSGGDVESEYEAESE